MPAPVTTTEKYPVQINNEVQLQPIKVDESLQPVQELSKVSVSKPPTSQLGANTQMVSGSHQDWMSQAGIQPGDYAYVEYIISHESGWRPDAVNKSSGACGLVQALPCSKLGADWSNPVTALKWGDRYAKARYGSWAKAHTFWQANHWW